MKENRPLIFANPAEWREWLAANHANAKEAWVVLKNARSLAPGLRYDEAVNEALAYGWIDSVMRKLDKDSTVQRYTPRRKGSNWSELNKAKVSKLISDGKMTEAGLAAVEAAKKSGRW